MVAQGVSTGVGPQTRPKSIKFLGDVLELTDSEDDVELTHSGDPMELTDTEDSEDLGSARKGPRMETGKAKLSTTKVIRLPVSHNIQMVLATVASTSTDAFSPLLFIGPRP